MKGAINIENLHNFENLLLNFSIDTYTLLNCGQRKAIKMKLLSKQIQKLFMST